LLTVAFFAFLIKIHGDDTDYFYDRVTDEMWNFEDEINQCYEVENCKFVFEQEEGPAPAEFIISVSVNSEFATEDEAYIFALRHILYRFATDEDLMQNFWKSSVLYNYISIIDDNENEIISFSNIYMNKRDIFVWSYSYDSASNLYGHSIDSDGITIYKNFKSITENRDSARISDWGITPENIVAHYTWDEVFDDEFSRESVLDQIASANANIEDVQNSLE